MVPSPASTASYTSARVEAAIRTAMVEVASSWSAISTMAALTARMTSGVGSAVRADARCAAIEPARSMSPAAADADRPPASATATASTSTIDAVTRLAVRTTVSGRRSARKGSRAPAITTAQRIRSDGPRSGGRPRASGDQSSGRGTRS